MSCYIVSSDMIGFLATAVIDRWGQYPDIPSRFGTMNEIAAILAKANIDSWNERYGEEEEVDTHFRPLDPTAVYMPHDGLDKKALKILAVLRCYTYQSCESASWQSNNRADPGAGRKAREYCDWLQGRAIAQLTDHLDWDAPKPTPPW